jgi:hypothetical protein
MVLQTALIILPTVAMHSIKIRYIKITNFNDSKLNSLPVLFPVSHITLHNSALRLAVVNKEVYCCLLQMCFYELVPAFKCHDPAYIWGNYTVRMRS